MSDYRALIDKAREWDTIGPYEESGVIIALADAVGALVAGNESLSVRFRNQMDANEELIRQLERVAVERDALRAQLDSMTTEWGTLYEFSMTREFYEASESEDAARHQVELSPYDTSLRKRLVGPWIGVTDV